MKKYGVKKPNAAAKAKRKMGGRMKVKIGGTRNRRRRRR